MSAAAFVSLGFLIVILLIAIIPLGTYMARVYENGKVPGDHVFNRVERLIYRIIRIDPDREQRWNVYTLSLLAFSLVSVLGLYFFQRVQTWLPLNNGLANVNPKVSWNTAVSFVTNTNWQSYSGESTMGHGRRSHAAPALPQVRRLSAIRRDPRRPAHEKRGLDIADSHRPATALNRE
jgi:K+-transporting ATPase ATPase A chain